MDERLARQCLAAISEPGHRAVAAAVQEFPAAEVWAGLVSGPDGPMARRARALRPEELQAQTRATGQRFVIPGDEEWPQGLGGLNQCEPVAQLSGEPLGLWLRGPGHLGELSTRAVAIVGARASTGYGDTVAAELAAGLSEVGRPVVSGGAYGIDAAAHRGALAGPTPTVAVLAGGLDQPYPAGHAALFSRICEAGVLVSERPAGDHPTRVRFLARNRLIAAITEGAVIVEAAMRSGARNTITWAQVLNRVAMAVPGPVTSAASVTPHRLIREAEAVLVTSTREVIELLSPVNPGVARPPGERRPTDQLSSEELRVFEVIPSRGDLGAGEVALRAGVAVPTCLALLNRLADQGFVAQTDDGGWKLAPSRRGDPVHL